jgi:hypothetical protein
VIAVRLDDEPPVREREADEPLGKARLNLRMKVGLRFLKREVGIAAAVGLIVVEGSIRGHGPTERIGEESEFDQRKKEGEPAPHVLKTRVAEQKAKPNRLYVVDGYLGIDAEFAEHLVDGDREGLGLNRLGHVDPVTCDLN